MKSVLIERYQMKLDSMEFPELKKEKKFIELVNKINKKKKLINALTDILKYDIGNENVELLKKYEEVSNEDVISELEGITTDIKKL